MKSILLVLVFLFSITTTCLQAQAIKPEDIVPDIGSWDIVKMSPCQPPGYAFTAMCLIISKDGKEMMSIHDIQTKECLELRTTEKVIYRKGWVRT